MTVFVRVSGVELREEDNPVTLLEALPWMLYTSFRPVTCD